MSRTFSRKKHCTAFIIFILVIISTKSFTQGTSDFRNEIDALNNKYDSLWDNNKETIVFTGSSSIRFWKELESSFPEHQILNTGFGGSQSADLLYYLDDLVLRYNPKKVYIYEGDNDLWSKKKPKQILATTKEIVQRIKEHQPATKIILISAKPSISRWRIRRKYKRLNRRYEKLTIKDIQLDYIDVWSAMLENRKLRLDLFIEDGLHMNQKGYDIWYTVLKDNVEN